MNNHRLYRKSKKIVGKGDIITVVGKEAKSMLAKDFVREKLNEILSKKKTGAGLKIFLPK
jgi:hypothetical protein